jgi:TolB-like protein
MQVEEIQVVNAEATEGVGQGNAAILVTGSIRASHDLLRINTHMIDVASGCYL